MKKFIFMIMAFVATVTMSAQNVLESKTFDNVYVSVSAGGAIQTQFLNGFDDLDRVRPVFGFEIGKDFTTLYGMSFEGKTTVNNKGIHTAFDDFSVMWKHKINLTNAIWGFKQEHLWEWKVVGGLGWGHDNGCVVDNYLVAEAGTEVIYNINDKFSVNVKPTYKWSNVENGLDVNKSEIQLAVGFTYKLPNKGGGRGFKVCERDFYANETNRLMNEVNQLRELENAKNAELEKSRKLLAEKDNLIAELNARKMTTNNIVVPSVIGFEIGKSDVLNANKGSLLKLSEFLKENNEFNVTVEGYADAKTGSVKRNQKLSEMRANAVKNILINNGVDEKRITAVGKGSSIQPFGENDVNRAVITIVQ